MVAAWIGAAPVVHAQSFVALMEGQKARPLNGRFNNVPVLHSNQPEEVEGPGILISTTSGSSVAAETGEVLRNAEYTFNGDFGMHLHHKYIPANRNSIASSGRRQELTLAAILINPFASSVRIRFDKGAVRNSFEAPYLVNNLMGVKPLGPRPWNTGPGDATAVQMLREKLDPRFSNDVILPPYSRLVLFQTQLPALGIANALLKGRSDGPFQMAVVAVDNPRSDDDILAVLDQGRLAPGRVYLNRIAEINNRRIFSRVGGVALGDSYQASISHDLTTQGPLHVPLTSTERHHFGTGEIQVNSLASRMLDSSLDNVGTYGVRFDIDLKLRGQGPYELVLSHPSPSGGRDFIAFRGSIQILTDDGGKDVHVGLRSGESLSLTQLQLRPDRDNSVRLSLVYPADATPGHLLSVVPSSQLAQVQEQLKRLALARAAIPQAAKPAAPPPAMVAPPPPLTLVPIGADAATTTLSPSPPPLLQRPLRLHQGQPALTPGFPLQVSPPQGNRGADSQIDRYRQAIEAQQRMMQGWNQP